jgi:ketosteroid isomerase-like protein
LYRSFRWAIKERLLGTLSEGGTVKMLKKTFQAWRYGGVVDRFGIPGRSTLKAPNEMAVLLCVLSAFSMACGGRAQSVGDAKADDDAVRQQVTKYTQALDAADTGIARQVWLTTPEASFISPMGHSHGWEEVKKVYDFFGASFTYRKLTARDIAVDVHGDSAYVEFYWHYSAKQKSDGKDVQTDGRESQMYRRVDGGGRWALVHVHYSGMPVTP